MDHVFFVHFLAIYSELLNLAIPDMDGMLCIFSDIRLMSNHDDSLAFLIELGKDIHNFITGLGIQIPGRFIGQDKRRISDNRTCDSDPLLLSSRKLFWLPMHFHTQSDFFKRLSCP